ncbi:YicC/YloC family endoribonuclease [Rubritalea marina]|uniref:YicC/YloC family endoribonuclease n=1 Tax=Rubritalea marina TaxID=361055 RepID=UPI00037E549F|nr:YicC/YloC family endoribonuclease [Rubritalea marina]
MMKSMTGFGRGNSASDTLICNVEVSSVNRKQCEVVIQIPRSLSELESPLRKLVLQKVSRGRVNVSISIERNGDAEPSVQIDVQKAKALTSALDKLAHEIGQPLSLNASDILRTPDIISFDEEDIELDKASPLAHSALGLALDQLIEMRRREGDDLKQDSLERLTMLQQLSNNIEAQAPSVVTRYKNNMMRRLAEANLEISLDDERLLKEIGIYAEKCDISEEITRLRSHFNKFTEYLNSPEPVGRSLDFLCQEINREFNTIGSKANDATLAQFVVSAKTELEKIREQIQNVE